MTAVKLYTDFLLLIVIVYYCTEVRGPVQANELEILRNRARRAR